MKYHAIKLLNEKLYFSSKDVADVLHIKEASARVLCTRYVKSGLFVRLKKDFYLLREKWERLKLEELLTIANFLQVPSYISLMTALSFYEVTTQVQRGFFESVCIKRTAKYEIDSINFYFYKLKKELYFDFVKMDDFFIATKEKAFLDAMYLYSFGKYSFDLDSIDLSKLDVKKISELVKNFPEKTIKLVKRKCRI